MLHYDYCSRRRQVPSPVRGLEAMQRHLSRFWAARLHAAKLIPVQSLTLFVVLYCSIVLIIVVHCVNVFSQEHKYEQLLMEELDQVLPSYKDKIAAREKMREYSIYSEYSDFIIQMHNRERYL